MLLKGQDDGTTRLSVRTKPGGVDATVLTGTFGGGGHARAAGATDRAAARRGGRRRGRRGRAPGRGRPAGEPGRAVRRARRRPDRRQAVGADLARRGRPRPAPVVDPPGRATAGRSTRSPRACCRCSWAARRGSSSTTSGRPSATARRSASASGRRPTTSTASGRRSTGPPATRDAVVAGLAAFTGPDPPGPARLQRGPDRRPAGVPARALGRSPSSSPPRDVAIHALDLVEWDDADPARPIAVVDVSLLGRDVHPGARAGPRRAPGHRRLPRGARAHRVGRLPARGRDRRSTTCAPTRATDRRASRAILRPIDAGLEDLPARRDHRATRSGGSGRA